MPKDLIEKVFNALTDKPQTPSEIAETLGINQKSVQTILLELTLTNNKVNYKKIGRYRVFWKPHVTEDESI